MGLNNYGPMMAGDTTNRLTPTLVGLALSSLSIAVISAGWYT
jgi:hypothetical protein